MASLRALVLLALTAMAGCTTALVREDRSAPTGLAPGDTMAVLLSSSLDDERLAQLEQTLAGCLRAGLGHGYANLRIVSSKEFFNQDAPQTADGQGPARRFSWDSLAGDPAFYGRIVALKLRYLIVINAEEGSRLTGAQWSGGAKMLGVPGPLVHWAWENSALLEAIVLDAKERRLSGTVQALASGKSGAGLMLLTFPFPIPVPYVTPSFPLSAACRGFGEGLAKFLTGETPAKAEAGASKSGGQSVD